jgi:hypothetical protein
VGELEINGIKVNLKGIVAVATTPRRKSEASSALSSKGAERASGQYTSALSNNVSPVLS